MGSQAPHDIRQLVANLREDVIRIEDRISALKRLHPERMTAHDWTDLRSDMLNDLAMLKTFIGIAADLLEQREVLIERSHSGRCY